MRWNVIAATAILALSSLPLAVGDDAVPTSSSVEIHDWRYVLSIHEMARADDDEHLAQLLKDNPDRAGLRLPDGRTAVHVATEFGSLKSLRVLAKAGADLNAVDGKSRTPLSIALGSDFVNTTKTLLELGADASKDAYWEGAGTALQPPLSIAARRGNVELLKAMLDAKADINHKGPDGATALTLAATNHHWPAVELLLDKGANPNTRDADGVTALIAASAAGNEKEVVLLLEKGADPRQTDRAGRAPLSVTESPALWKMLVAKGADVNVVVSGSTPLQYFIAQGKLQLVKVFLEFHPDPFVTDRKGHTAKELARQFSVEHSADMNRREIAQVVEAYQKKYAADEEAREHPATRPK